MVIRNMFTIEQLVPGQGTIKHLLKIMLRGGETDKMSQRFIESGFLEEVFEL